MKVLYKWIWSINPYIIIIIIHFLLSKWRLSARTAVFFLHNVWSRCPSSLRRCPGIFRWIEEGRAFLSKMEKLGRKGTVYICNWPQLCPWSRHTMRKHLGLCHIHEMSHTIYIYIFSEWPRAANNSIQTLFFHPFLVRMIRKALSDCWKARSLPMYGSQRDRWERRCQRARKSRDSAKSDIDLHCHTLALLKHLPSHDRFCQCVNEIFTKSL